MFTHSTDVCACDVSHRCAVAYLRVNLQEPCSVSCPLTRPQGVASVHWVIPSKLNVGVALVTDAFCRSSRKVMRKEKTIEVEGVTRVGDGWTT